MTEYLYRIISLAPQRECSADSISRRNTHRQSYKVTDFWHLGDESGLAWNDPAIGIEWPQLVGEYPGSADGSGYTLEDGTPINLSDKDQKWETLENTFKF